MVNTIRNLRPSGIPVLGEISWGSHFCQFYQTKAHLRDVLVPYFQKGLENNEFCVWVTSKTMTVDEAREALSAVVPDLAEREAKGQFEVFPYTDWYLAGGRFDMKRILDGWAEKYRQGLARGFAGLRVSGDTAWLESENWADFSAYEQSIDGAIEGSRILVLCTYSLDRCGPYELLDVVRNHQFALVLGQRGWERIENAELARLRELQQESQEQLRRTAETIRQQSEWLRVTLTSIGDAVIATDTAAQVTFLNPVAAELTGWGRQEAIGQPIGHVLRTIDENTRQPAADVVAQVLSEKRTVAMANHTALLRRDGREIPIEDSAAPILDAAGNVTGVVLVFHDVTERRRAQDALLRAKQEWERTFDSVPDLIAILDSQHRILRVNRAMAQRLGTTPEQCLGRHCYKGVHDTSKPPEFCPHTQTLRDGLEHTAEVHEDRLGGDFLVTTTPLRDEQGRMTGTVHVARDITAMKRSEEELHRAKQLAEDASRAKDQFIAVLSHELRTPLTPSLAAAGAMLKDPRLPEDVRADAAMIQRNIGLEVALINDLLDVTRIANGKLLLKKSRVDVAHIVREAAGICCGDLDAKNQTLTIELPDAPYPVEADAARLHQVFWNLIRNAIKFTPDRGRIEIKATLSGSRLRISVCDNGVGIDEAVMPRLFSAFEQGEQNLLFGGLGLGLVIAKGVVEAHGGRISATSEGRDKGATFTVELPLTTGGGRAEVDTRKTPQPPASNRQVPAPLRILLVEDHADTARMMARLLMAEGHEVVTADCIRAALSAADNGTFDVLMSDLGLPDGTGHELMRQLLSAGKRIKGIAISGYGTASDMQASRAAGFSDHITKPITFDALRDALIRIANGA